MRKVTQTITEVGKGDCFSACVASILECDLAKLPVYNAGNWFWDWEKFLKLHGVMLLGKGGASYYWDAYWIATVPSLNNEGRRHAVVMYNNSLAHDPNEGMPGSKWYNELSYEDCTEGYCVVLSDAGLFRKSSLYA